MKPKKHRRYERITPGSIKPSRELDHGVVVREFACSRLGAVGFSTGMASFGPGARLAYHYHKCGESLTVLRGEAELVVEGRTYRLLPFDSAHVPGGVAHALNCIETSGELIIHTAFSSSQVSWAAVRGEFRSRNQNELLPKENNPESLRRFADVEEYELSANAFFKDLFARRFGSAGICGGYGRFFPGASLPCHTHEFDESITILEGKATCLVGGRRYTLTGYDTALVPAGLAHRFINESDTMMTMLWVYAGDEPERTVVDDRFCSIGDARQ